MIVGTISLFDFCDDWAFAARENTTRPIQITIALLTFILVCFGKRVKNTEGVFYQSEGPSQRGISTEIVYRSTVWQATADPVSYGRITVEAKTETRKSVAASQDPVRTLRSSRQVVDRIDSRFDLLHKLAMSMKQKMNHPVPELPVADVVRAQEYYRDVLGFEIGWLEDGQEIGAVSRDGVAIFLRRRASPFEPSAHWVFTEDLDAAFEELDSSGADIDGPPETKPWGLRQFTLRDCDGNVFHFHSD